MPDAPTVEELRALALAAGVDALGVAPADAFDGTRRDLEERKAAGLHGGMHFTYGDPARSTDPARALAGARSLVVGARRYRRADPPPPAQPAGAVARYARADHYGELRAGLEQVADRLRASGWQARVLCDDNALVDREAAHRAGLGWYGKNANLLLPGQGSWFVLGSVVTDAPLAVAEAPVADGCGTCTRCIDACPTGAIVAPGVVDARRCLAWLVQARGSFPLEHRAALGGRLYGCDDCQEVCPPNRTSDRRQPPEDVPGEEAWVPLVALLASGDEELLARHGRWYIPRRDPRWLRRNALVALGNVGAAGDPAVEETLRRYAEGEDELLAEHAEWARARVGRAGGLVTRHLLVTNDFPPKVGGIQSYLWELWRRLPADEFTVLTSPHADAAAFDAEQPFRVVRTREPVLLPTPSLRRRIDELAEEVGARLVVLDPALPVGHLGPSLQRPYAVVLHGAEVTVPGRLPGSRQLLGAVLRGAAHVIAAGTYPAEEGERAAGRSLPTTVVPPGVDAALFHPLDGEEKRAARKRLGLPEDGPLVMGISRLVPRKGFDTLIRAAALLAPERPGLTVGIVGGGRDRGRLERLAASTNAPVRFLGRIPFGDLPDAYACGDVFAMLSRNRWGGLEQEGFGIVFVEAAAAGVPSVAGESGGVRDAVVDGETGLVVGNPTDPVAVAAALARLLDDADERTRLGRAARRRAAEELSYDVLADRLWRALQEVPC